MQKETFSLFTPEGKDATYNTLSKEAINDLSVDYVVQSLTKDGFEQNSIKQLLTTLTDDEEVIRYRCNVFEDFLHFPKLRADLCDVLEKLKYLRDIERFQKDSESSSLSIKPSLNTHDLYPSFP